ncbi:MAG TPA: hypothetical protein VKT32_05805 [Chthonomonadaceae bacterium]|nr:hypothetical protein [Chthonomonadaceae bacterium]
MRRQTRSAYYIDQEGSEKEQISRGITWLDWSIGEHHAAEAWLVTPAHVSLRGAIQEVLGDAAVTALLGRRDLAINGTLFRHHTELTLPYTASSTTILSAYPIRKLLDKLDNLSGVVAMAVVPASGEEAQTWITTWQAVQAIVRTPQ